MKFTDPCVYTYSRDPRPTVEITLAGGMIGLNGPTGPHSVLLRDQSGDECVGLPRGRAAVHAIGYLLRNELPIGEIARAVTHILQGTIASFGPSNTFQHAEFRRGLLAAWNCGRRARKGSGPWEAAGYRAGVVLRPYVNLH